MLETSRRRVLQTVGVGGTAATIAGCASQEDPQATDSPTATDATTTPDVERVAADPTDVPDPIDRESPTEVDVTLRPEEVTAEVEDGVTFDYMTYNGRIPGPMIRVRRGDTVNLTFENPEDNGLPHNVDFHAVYGPGGGADATMTAPGETERLRFEATYPGAYIYHCAVANLDVHISAGMFGIILVEPEDGLPEVDHELYLGQHELYTDREAGEEGHHSFSVAAMREEAPTYVVMNGEKYALTPDRHGPAATVDRGDTARVYFVTGGPNLTSSFHPIGNVWSELYPEGSLSADPLTHVQTKPVAPGSCAVATMEFPVPGPVKLVDHALSRVARRGCMAVVEVEGEANPGVFDPEPDA